MNDNDIMQDHYERIIDGLNEKIESLTSKRAHICERGPMPPPMSTLNEALAATERVIEQTVDILSGVDSIEEHEELQKCLEIDRTILAALRFAVSFAAPEAIADEEK